MARVYHGRMDTAWCRSCRSPLLKGNRCPSCGSKAEKVVMTPPGDARPAFPGDISEVMGLADQQWGAGAGEALMKGCGPVLLNPCPAPDRLEEIIIDGEVVGSVQFDARRRRSSLILRERGGKRLQAGFFKPLKGMVTADASAVPFLLEGKNLMCPGIIDSDPDVAFGDEVVVADPSGTIVGSGIAKKPGGEMVSESGVGVKMRWSSLPEALYDTDGPIPLEKDLWRSQWDRVIEVNSTLLDQDVRRAKRFILEVAGRHERTAVSYSGGKDSLATLHLVLEAGLSPRIMFVDTGLEFPETVKNVHDTVADLGLELLEARPMGGFFENLETFGPPGRDHRWCCKVCKLGPTSRLISQYFPDGVLTFIGQRRYESDSRKKKGAVWTNPWVPGQTGASPIQEWTALEVWMYILRKGAVYNPLYEMGFQRIGCWLCPSCDMAEMELVERTGVDRSRWEGYLRKQQEIENLPVEWIVHGFHRFKRLPPHMKRLAAELGLDPSDLVPRARRETPGPLALIEGTNTCVDGISREGTVSASIDFRHLARLLDIFGEVEEDPETGGLSVRPPGWNMSRAVLEVYPDGTLVVRGEDNRQLERNVEVLASLVLRSLQCIGCSICAGRCPENALSVAGGRVQLDTGLCIHCRRCLGPCPAEQFTDDPFGEPV
ncbi:MAG: phosphoadenosine phosphosulfate reductase family protein [Thermoplasmatota archaeon]